MFGMEKEGSEILYHDLPQYTEKTFQEECDSHVMGKPYILLIVTNLKNIS